MIDQVVTFDYRSARGWRTAGRGRLRWWWEAFRLTRSALWIRRFDLAFSPRPYEDTCQVASTILMHVSGARWRAAYFLPLQMMRRFTRRILRRMLTHSPPSLPHAHEVEMQFALLRYLGLPVDQPQLGAWVSPEHDQRVECWWRESGLAECPVVAALAPGAAWAFRKWPVERFATVARWIHDEYGGGVVILGSRGDREGGEDILQSIPKTSGLNLAGKASLCESIAALKRCHVFLGSDSGPLHLASAAGVPVVGLYGPGDFTRFRPWPADAKPLSLHLDCSPCGESCLYDEPRCILGLTVEHVQTAIREQLSRHRPA
jgi:heptosyltransferase-2